MDIGGGNKGLTAEYIARAAEDSLRRLQTDRVDLYSSRLYDPDTPLEEALGAHAKLIAEGKVRATGASNYKGARLREAMETARRNNLPLGTFSDERFRFATGVAGNPTGIQVRRIDESQAQVGGLIENAERRGFVDGPSQDVAAKVNCKYFSATIAEFTSGDHAPSG